MLVAPLLLVADEGREIEDVLHDVFEADGVGLDVVLVLVVGVDVVPELMMMLCWKMLLKSSGLMCYLTWLRKKRSKWTSGWWRWWMWSMGVMRMRLRWKEGDVELLVVVLLLVANEVAEQEVSGGCG